MWLKKGLTYERRSEACINDRVWSSWCDCGWQDVKIQLLIATTPANPVKHISQDIPVTNIHTSPAEILILSFCESSVKINYFPLFTKHYSAQLHLWFPFRGTVCPFFTAPPCHTHRVAEGFNFVRHVQHSHPCCSSLSILHQYVPFISSPHLTASPFSEISHDNVPAGLRDVHRTICGVFFCVIRADLLVMVFAWCAQNYQWRFAWDAHRCQWRLVCDVHRTISDGLCVMGTDLSVRLKASIPPTLSAHTPSPPHPTPPHLIASPSFLHDFTLRHTWWFVRDAHSAISCVHVLSPSPCCPKRVNFKVLGVHTDVYLQNNLLPLFLWHHYFWHVCKIKDNFTNHVQK